MRLTVCLSVSPPPWLSNTHDIQYSQCWSLFLYCYTSEPRWNHIKEAIMIFCEKYFRALTIEWEKSLGGGEFRTPVAGTFVTQTQDQKADERLYKSTLPDMGCAVPWYSLVLGTCCTQWYWVLVVVFATWYMWYSMVHGTYGARRCWVVLNGVATAHFFSTVDLEPHHDTVLCHVQGLQMQRTTPFS